MNRPLQRRGGRNHPGRTGSGFSIEVVQNSHYAQRIKGSPFTLVERGIDEDPVVLVGMQLTIGLLTNNTLAPIDVEFWLIDAEGREMSFAGSGPVPAATTVPVILQFTPQITAWVLAPGERVELRITAGDPNVVDGFWWWPNKQIIASPLVTVRKLMNTTSFEDVIVPPPGVSHVSPGFVFEGPFVGATLFNYSPNPTTADVVLETEDGDFVLETAVAVGANGVTALMQNFFGGWGVSSPQKLKVRLGSVPVGGDVVFAGCYQEMDVNPTAE